MPRSRTVGRYKTRDELERMIWAFYRMKGSTIASVARICRVSTVVIDFVLSDVKPRIKRIESRSDQPRYECSSADGRQGTGYSLADAWLRWRNAGRAGYRIDQG